MQKLISILNRWTLVAAFLCLTGTLALAQVPPAGSDLPNPSSGTLVPGYILAKRVTGTVKVMDDATQQLRQVKEGDRLKQGETVITAPDKQSSVVLVFSSGATVQLGADTQLGIERFLQELWSGNYNIGEAEKEPSTSQVKLEMARGEIVGKIIKLDKDRGSSFTIRTPIGVAGVRGTTVAGRYRANENDPTQIVAVIAVLEGVMSFAPTLAPGAGEGGEVLIPGNNELVVNVVSSPGRPPQIATPPSQLVPAPLSPASTVLLQSGVQQILQTTENLVVPPPPPTVPTPESQTESQGQNQQGQNGSGEAAAFSPAVSETAPPAVPSLPRITGGDGQPRN